MDDNKILKLYFNRSEKAITETSNKYGRYCYSVAFNILNNKQDSEECVNDTYLRAWNSIPPKQPNCLRTFLAKITRNLSLNKYEKQTAFKRGGGTMPLILDELTECIPANTKTEQTADIVIKDVINSVLADLSPEKRNIFVRRYWYISPIKDIARDLCITESKVTVTLFRVREILKKALEKEGISL